ncbi:MAG TPA: alpha/beta hydrolase [Rhodocyclaceae bacterium]|jgi:acetyl esterase/lipase|nr:alpha/beta hydrolase [Rhodocyclaceae bacterium]
MNTVITQELVYRTVGDRSLKALIFRPETPGPWPALLCLHGGAWISGDRTATAYLGEKLAATGIVVVSIDFRMAPKHRYPSSLLDVNFAIRWMKANAAAFDIDSGNIGGLGISSGGHLILLAAMRPAYPTYITDIPDELSRVDARLTRVITCSGVLDPLARYRMAQQAGYAEILACHRKYFGNEAAMEEGNPPRILERGELVELPPLLMFQGKADPRLPSDTAMRVADVYRAAGGIAEAHYYADMGHALSEWTPENQDDVVRKINVFMA